MKQIHFNITISIIIVILTVFVGIFGVQYYETKNQYYQTKEELTQQKIAQEQRAKAVAEMNANNLWQEYCNKSRKSYVSSEKLQAGMLSYYGLVGRKLVNKNAYIETELNDIKHINETLNKRKEYCNESIDYTKIAESFELPSSEMLGVMKQEFMDQDMMKRKLNECNNLRPLYDYGYHEEDGEKVFFRDKDCYNTSTQIKKRVQVVNSKGEIIREEKEIFFDLEEFKNRPIADCKSASC